MRVTELGDRLTQVVQLAGQALDVAEEEFDVFLW